MISDHRAPGGDHLKRILATTYMPYIYAKMQLFLLFIQSSDCDYGRGTAYSAERFPGYICIVTAIHKSILHVTVGLQN